MFYYYNNISFYVGTLAQALKSLPAMWEPEVGSLDPEDPLEEEIDTLSSNFAWEIPWTEDPGGLQSMGSQRVGYDLVTKNQQQYF